MTNEKTNEKAGNAAKYTHVLQVSSAEWTFQLRADKKGNIYEWPFVKVEQKVEYEGRENYGYTGRYYTEYKIEYQDGGRWAFGATVSFQDGKKTITPLEEGFCGYDADYYMNPSEIVPGENGEVIVKPKNRKAPVNISIDDSGITIADKKISFTEDVLMQLQKYDPIALVRK
ncbi:MAG: hypothetical protein LVQ95_00465 [Candidatus Micrarchaeales archaeon]|nr:hypothetical protein [Candidatus Micrarchaeales archaeon]